MDHLCYFLNCVCHVFASVRCCLVVTCWKRADLLAPVCDVYCDCVTFPSGILGQVCYLIVSIPDHCCLSYLKRKHHPSKPQIVLSLIQRETAAFIEYIAVLQTLSTKGGIRTFGQLVFEVIRMIK